MSKLKNIYNTAAYVTGHTVLAGILIGAATLAGVAVVSKLSHKTDYEEDYDDEFYDGCGDPCDDLDGPEPDEEVPAPGESELSEDEHDKPVHQHEDHCGCEDCIEKGDA